MNPEDFDQNKLHAAAFNVSASVSTIADADDAHQEIRLYLLKKDDDGKPKAVHVHNAKWSTWAILNRSAAWAWGPKRDSFSPISYDVMLENGYDEAYTPEPENDIDAMGFYGTLSPEDRMFLRLVFCEDLPLVDLAGVVYRVRYETIAEKKREILEKAREYITA